MQQGSLESQVQFIIDRRSASSTGRDRRLYRFFSIMFSFSVFRRRDSNVTPDNRWTVRKIENVKKRTLWLPGWVGQVPPRNVHSDVPRHQWIDETDVGTIMETTAVSKVGLLRFDPILIWTNFNFAFSI